ncbi:MAG: hypothetical protein IPJ65_26140 [Archangiaceae bacterium]|nr:hypothetical protein [Archangiaceae bacterium]
MTPELVLPIGGAPPVSRPMLLSFAGQLFGQVCGVPLPPVALDGGLDADGGRLDGGLVDGGFGCALLSYTNNGFVRFTEPFGDARERALLNVSNLGAALLDDGGLEVRSLADGKLRLFTPLEGAVHPRGVASAVDARPWFLSAVPDAGVSLWRVEWEDAGQVTRVREGLDASVSLLALDERGNAWVSGGGVVGYLEVDDAGRAGEPRWSPATAPLTDTLATGGGFAFGGATQFVASAPDAGLIPAVGWLDDAGQPLRVQERFSLVSQQRAFVFYRQCPSPLMSCGAEDDELWLRQLELATGNVLDDARLSPPFRDARVVEASLLELSGYPPGVMSLIQLHRDGGAAAYLQLSVGSAGDLTCPLPEQSDVAGAAIGAGYLWVYGNRDGGPYALEAYPLTGVPLSGSAWPLADGVAGQRRAR